MKFPLETKNVVLTGVGGFIGAHFLEWFMEHTGWYVVGIDSFMHKGTYSRLDDIKNLDNDRFRAFYHDLTAPIDTPLATRIERWFGSHSPAAGVHFVVNLASNSAVERSITDPVECWRNNCNLISNMLEYSRHLPWLENFLHISTDEVYGEYHDANGKGHVEWDRIMPSNPYAASKAAQEALCIAYWRSYKLPIVVANTMNNIGERQDTEKFLPKIISKIAQGEKLSIYVDDKDKPGSRVYLDAKVHAAAAVHILGQPVPKYRGISLEKMDKWNICGEVELDNLAFAGKVAKIMGQALQYELVKAESARPGYDKRYLLNPSRLKMSGFVPPYTFDQTLERIVKHTIQNNWWMNTEFPVETPNWKAEAPK